MPFHPPSSAPKNYACPICLGVRGVECADTLLMQADLVYKDDLVAVFINSFFAKTNDGHAIVVPATHFESLYTLPAEYGHRIFDVSQKVALAMRASYGCEGITTRQNNEPVGDQHAFHYHLHVYPRYKDDHYNNASPADKYLAGPGERAAYARKLKRALQAYL